MLHQPVLLQPILDFIDNLKFQPRAIIDGTFGRGGHSRAFLDKFPDTKLVGCDRDKEAIEYGLEIFNEEISTQQLKLIKTNFIDIREHQLEWKEFFGGRGPDLILLDLGVSSPQLDVGDRGFSFYHEGPLDMRMDLEQELTAYEIINHWSEQEISDLFYHLGEIRFPNKVVRAIAAKRKEKPIETTIELSELIARADGWRKKGKHPATQYFLALRLQVNRELENIKESLEKMLDILEPGGLLMVISFHSVEDRIVKNLFKSFKEQGTILTKKVIQAERLEIKDNPRSRSAKLRVFQKGENP